MKNKMFLIVIILVFVLLFTGAYVLYERLGEGVETEQQLDILSEMGCNHFQGYYFSKPVSVAEFEAMTNNEEL